MVSLKENCTHYWWQWRIGLATAKQFVNEDAYVFITGRREQELAGGSKGDWEKCNRVQGDVSKPCRS